MTQIKKARPKSIPAALFKKSFSAILLRWNAKSNTRQMPWKGEKDPYKVWLSEIILQQTRVEQGLSYYNRFIDAFPDVTTLAKAPEDKVFKLWEGLGYYSRCRNLIATAKYIATDLKGEFPSTFNDIQSLKGIGPYTAAAISSFVFNLPHAVVDGNVYRVLSRVFGIRIPIDSTIGKKHFTALAAELLDKKQPGLYNQAIMDFGATICKPAPLCNQCPFKTQCFAFLNDAVADLPVKEKRISIRHRWFNYLVIEYKGEIAIRQRTGKDIWQQLFEFPLIETEQEEPVNTLLNKAIQKQWLTRHKPGVIESGIIKQKLSHQLIIGRFIKIGVYRKPKLQTAWVWIHPDQLASYAFPQIINQYLRQKTISVSF